MASLFKLHRQTEPLGHLIRSEQLPSYLSFLSQPNISSHPHAKEAQLLCNEENLLESPFRQLCSPSAPFLVPSSHLWDGQFQMHERLCLLWIYPHWFDLVLQRTFKVFLSTGAEQTFPNHCLWGLSQPGNMLAAAWTVALRLFQALHLVSIMTLSCNFFYLRLC